MGSVKTVSAVVAHINVTGCSTDGIRYTHRRRSYLRQRGELGPHSWTTSTSRSSLGRGPMYSRYRHPWLLCAFRERALSAADDARAFEHISRARSMKKDEGSANAGGNGFAYRRLDWIGASGSQRILRRVCSAGACVEQSMAVHSAKRPMGIQVGMALMWRDYPGRRDEAHRATVLDSCERAQPRFLTDPG